MSQLLLASCFTGHTASIDSMPRNFSIWGFRHHFTIHEPEGGGLLDGLQSCCCPEHHQDWRLPHFPAGGRRCWSQPLAWPWCSAGPHIPGSSITPLPRSGLALTPGAGGPRWPAPSAWHIGPPPPSGCFPSWPSDFSWRPGWSPGTRWYLCSEKVISGAPTSDCVKWPLWCSPWSAATSTGLAPPGSPEPAHCTGPNVCHDLVEVLRFEGIQFYGNPELAVWFCRPFTSSSWFFFMKSSSCLRASVSISGWSWVTQYHQ